MRGKWILTGVLGLVLGAGVMAAAPHDSGQRPRFSDRPIGKLIMDRIGRALELRADLNLSDDQKEAIKSVLTSHKQEILEAVKPVNEARKTLRDAVLADKTDEESIRTAARDLGKSSGDAAVVLARIKAEVKDKAHLTEEQVKKLKEFHADNDAAMERFFKEAKER